MEQQYHHHEYSDGGDNHHDDGWGIGAIIVIFIILIIIGLLIWWFFRSSSTTLGPVWSFTSSGSTSSETFVADNFTVFTAAAPATGMTLTLTPPIDPVGKQFIIDNSGGVGIITIASGVTVTNTLTFSGFTTATPPVGIILPSNKIQARGVAEFIWKSPTSVLRIT